MNIDLKPNQFVLEVNSGNISFVDTQRQQSEMNPIAYHTLVAIIEAGSINLSRETILQIMLSRAAEENKII